jgi:eukaryotic-like serine/threonine-protein kinase
MQTRRLCAKCWAPLPEDVRTVSCPACALRDALEVVDPPPKAAGEPAGAFLKTPVVTAPPQFLPHGGRPHQFGDYELLEEIAHGGMGVVYKARQVSLNRVVAIKMILTGQLASEAEVSRFRSEAQAAACLNHRNIVGIHEVGEHQGRHYYTMPFLEGQTLAQLVESGQWQPADGTEAVRLLAKVARAVEYAHNTGILHRDLKPGNILIDPEGEPCVTDFGLAKRLKGEPNLTVTGQVLGTPGFMAPEQARGNSDQSTPATDIYGLGAVLYCLLTGRPPFVADSVPDALVLVLKVQPVPPRRINRLVPAPLEQVCLRCLEKQPEDRYLSAGALATDLERFLRGESLPVHPQAIGRRFEAWAKRQPALAARSCTVLVCLGVLTAYYRPGYATSVQHVAVIAVLLFWLLISFLCQRRLEINRWATWVRFVWSGADPVALTAILFFARAFSSPLVILYPTLIAASGYWLRVSVVATTTGLSLLGYVALLLGGGRLRTEHLPLRWQVLALLAMVVTGLTVGWLVKRVNALTRFYERRPTPNH